MRKIIGGVFQSLDGVMQAPGGPTEDPSGGFAHGGWLARYFDEVLGAEMGAFFGRPYDLLLGRRTYDIFAAHWPYATGEEAPMGEAFTRAAKYVLTRGDQPLEWENSHRLGSMDEVAEIKRSDGPDLLIQGSSTIYPGLLEHGLLDRLMVQTFPVVLGGGKRTFADGTPAGALKLVDQKLSPSGVVIATYEPDGPLAIGNAGEWGEPSAREQERRQRIKEGSW